jgi:hypothetical protein
MTPFAMTSPSQFLPPPPPSLTSQLWATDLAEVQAYGSATSTVRTPQETQTAQFWDSDTPVAIWDRAADQLARQQPMSLIKNARLLALMNIAMGDAVIAIWNAKNTHNFWRPVTAIRASSDPTWTPLRPTPPFQEYPSGHAGVSNAGASVLASFYGDDTSFTVTAAGLPGVERDFHLVPLSCPAGRERPDLRRVPLQVLLCGSSDHGRQDRQPRDAQPDAPPALMPHERGPGRAGTSPAGPRHHTGRPRLARTDQVPDQSSAPETIEPLPVSPKGKDVDVANSARRS